MTAAGASFIGRLALVTGAASGIGEAVCHVLAAEGVVVVAADKNFEAARKVADSLRGDNKHHAMYVDVGDTSSVEHLFEGIRKASAVPLSIVVHCAGIIRRAPLLDCSDELFENVTNVNLKGTFLVNRAASRDMLRSESLLPEGGAAIVNISSVEAASGSNGGAAYSASKAAVVALTKTAAQELAAHGIRCNAVLPGWVNTPMSASAAGTSHMAAYMERSPIKRVAEPSEIAEAIKFLCSPTASSFITGVALHVDGGYKM
ncbi:(3R)-3-hydroxyacyl-CoA dehydrogenase-like [Dermacentor variabilis]|uniref:(3R)-3-hydroxyacyl-CoA dehydrogenase-like n=1 Tax=Dermacentor variabilis TaxID=34621 RepID=UPI003F5C103C